MVSCVIIDDQREAVDLLNDHVKKISWLSLKMATTNPLKALSFLESEKTDIVFLDIQMPDITGLEFIENLRGSLGKNIPQFVLTTGYENYALASYEYGVFDYLLKPISFARFKKTVDRFASIFQKNDSVILELKFFFAEVDGKKIKINFSDIVYIEGAGNYIYVGMIDKRFIIYKSMNSMLTILPENDFIRTHKSYIIAVNRIQSIKGNEIILDLKDSAKCIPLGITFRESVLSKLKIVE